MTTYIIILLIFLILSAFFSASEVAFLALTEAKVDAMINQNIPKARQIKKLKKNARKLLVTILIGNNIVNIAASSIATVVMTQLFDSGVIGITTGIMTLLVLIFGEIMPKAYASNNPQKFTQFASRYLQLFQWIIYPIVSIFEGMTNLVAGKQNFETVSEEELKALAKTGARQGAIEKEESVMIERLFAFGDITAEDIMTPRVHVTFLEDIDTIKDAVSHIKAHPFTRYPVFHDTPDTILGFVHARDVLLAISDQHTNTLKQLIRPIVTIPKPMRIDDVMKEFQKKQTHMGVVVDEFGGTEGIVTFEDVIEELVGEIADEHDIAEDELIKRIDKQTIHVSGDTILKDVNHFLNTNIPGDEHDIMAEILLDAFQKLPEVGDAIELGNAMCVALEVRNRRIERIQIKKNVS